MKPPRKSVFQCYDKNQSKYCCKTCWKEQPLIFTVCLMNHIFQTFILLKYVIMKFIELNWLCKHMKKVRSSQAAIFVLNWVNCTELINFLSDYRTCSCHLFLTGIFFLSSYIYFWYSFQFFFQFLQVLIRLLQLTENI